MDYGQAVMRSARDSARYEAHTLKAWDVRSYKYQQWELREFLLHGVAKLTHSSMRSLMWFLKAWPSQTDSSCPAKPAGEH